MASADISVGEPGYGAGLERVIAQPRDRTSELEAENRELRQALLDLGPTREHLRHAFEFAPSGLCVLSSVGRILDLNSAASELLGIAPQEGAGRRFAGFFEADQQLRLEQELHRVLWDEPVSVGSIDLRPMDAKAGAAAVLRVRISCLPGADASAPRCLVNLEDVTELFELHESHARFLQIAAQVEEVYYETDDSGRIGYLSLGYEQVWRRSTQDACGEPWFRAVHPEDLAQVLEARRLLLKGDPFDEEYRIVLPQGEVRWVRDRAFLLEQASPRIVGVARDVTDDRALEDELRQAQKLEALGALASSVAHDFGNLLQGVIGCLNIALNSNSSDRSRDYLRQALMALKGGATLVSQLMRFSRKEPAQARPIGMDAAIFGCEKLLQRLVGDHIQVRIEAHAPQSLLVADPVQIEQILMNLAANARDAMPQGGQLLIRTEAVRKANASGSPLSFVQLEVKDLGCGMDQATRARVFEPFFTTKSAGKGTGLGLSTVRAVTRSLGGEVAVDSEPGRGTAFTFHFPTASTPLANEGAFQLERRFAGRVLLVEDDRRVRRSVRRALEELGFEVVEAGDAGEALSRADASLGLLVTDVSLPEVSGPKIREALAARYPNLKALYISAHSAPYLMQAGLLQKNDAILQKPFDVHDLAFQLAELCETVDSRVTRCDGARSDVLRSEVQRRPSVAND